MLKDERTLSIKKKTAIILETGMPVIVFLVLGFFVAVVLSWSNRDVQEQTSLPPSNRGQNITSENAAPPPDPPIADYDAYMVQKGATLSVIAKACSMEYGKTVTVQDIKDANDLKGDMLQPGRELKIPKR